MVVVKTVGLVTSVASVDRGVEMMTGLSVVEVRVAAVALVVHHLVVVDSVVAGEHSRFHL